MRSPAETSGDFFVVEHTKKVAYRKVSMLDW